MLRIHQPYIKSNRLRKTFAFASIGVLLLALGVFFAYPTTHLSSSVYAAGDSRTIHDISNMQDMTQQICSNTDIEDTADLKDSRDTNTCTIYKAADGNCWMGQNLALTGPLTLTSGDTDLASGATWQLPASTTSNFVQNDTTVQIRTGSGLSGWKNGWGNYYSWCAATANTCQVNGTPVAANVDAASSICPKGWKLPTYSGNYSFSTLTGTKSGWTTDVTFNGVSGNSGYYFGSTKTTLPKKANFWPAAGRFYTIGFSKAGSYGYYWSRRASSTTDAYNLYFGSSHVYPQYSSDRYVGFSVRCVAEGGLDKVEKPLFTTSEDENVNVNVPSVLTIDAASGLTETADANKIIEGTATATISSNTEYNVTLHSTQPSLKDPTVTTAEISPVSSSNPVQPGNNSWGFWDGTGSADTKTYTLPITTEPQSFPNTTTATTNTTGDPATLHTYYVGISISPSLPSGTYATDVIITASVK